VCPYASNEACRRCFLYCIDDTCVCTGCIECCRETKFSYGQVATRENEDFQYVIMPATSSVSFQNIALTELTRKYSGTKSGCNAGECGACGKCGYCQGLCSGLFEPCFYNGKALFTYAEDSSNIKTIDQLTKREAGHDDDAWSALDDMLLLSLTTAAETKHLFQTPDSAQCRALLVRRFGNRFSADQCIARLENVNKKLKTTDKCTSTVVRAVKITHWDIACQKVRAGRADYRDTADSRKGRHDVLALDGRIAAAFLTVSAACRCERQCVCAMRPKWAPTT